MDALQRGVDGVGRVVVLVALDAPVAHVAHALSPFRVRWRNTASMIQLTRVTVGFVWSGRVDTLDGRGIDAAAGMSRSDVKYCILTN